MEKKSEPEYMELTKDITQTTDKDAEAHIYELDVPKVPAEEAGSKSEDEKKEGDQPTVLEYHYVRNNQSRTSQMHVSAQIATLEREGALGKLGKVHKGNMKKLRTGASQKQKWTSLKCIAIIVLFILTVMNTILATAALAIGGIVYTRMETVTVARQLNSSGLGEGFSTR